MVGQGAGIKLRYCRVLGGFAERGRKRKNGRVKRKLCSVTCAAGLFKACSREIIKVYGLTDVFSFFPGVYVLCYDCMEVPEGS